MKPSNQILKDKNAGSALIMTVVLTTLLAIVGIMFVMSSRLDRASTSSIADAKALEAGMNAVIEIISNKLVMDSPGVNPDNTDYYDYPDANNAFLASIEPYDGGDKWRQISDVTGFLDDQGYECKDVDVAPMGLSTTTVVREYPEIEVDSDDIPLEQSADADGDGIADSKWIMIDDFVSPKGEPLYAAIRVVDNSAMLNINTAYEFDAESTEEDKIDGSNQMQINLAGILKGSDDIEKLHDMRSEIDNWDDYNSKVVWNFGEPNDRYSPFDISDELELRYRYCLDSRTVARVESDVNLPETFRGAGTADFGNLYDGTAPLWQLGDWQTRISDLTDTDSDRRHFVTTLNMDRIIDPNGEKMFNVRTGYDAQILYERLLNCIDEDNLLAAEIAERQAWLGQLAVNIVDYGDDDANVSICENPDNSDEYFGFERPFIYISEVVRNFRQPDPNGPVYKSFAIELRKHFRANDEFEDWTLEISNPGRTLTITDDHFNDRAGKYYVMIFEDPCAPLSDYVDFSDTPENGATGVDPEIVLRWDRMFLDYDYNDPNLEPIYADEYDVYFGTTNPPAFIGTQASQSYDPPGTLALDTTYYWRVDGRNDSADPNLYHEGPIWSFTTWDVEPNSVVEYIDANSSPFVFDVNTTITLYRPTESGDIVVDELPYDIMELPAAFFDESTVAAGVFIISYQRDLGRGHVLKRLWGVAGRSLGHWNNYSYPGTDPDWDEPIRPYYHSFDNVGDVSQLFRKTTYLEGDSDYWIDFDDDEYAARIDLRDQTQQKIFQYVTLFDPAWNDANETRIKGRININTAPVHVIKQLPWITDSRFEREGELAEAIVDFRDKTNFAIDYTGDNGRATTTGITDIYEAPGFRSIGELAGVITQSTTDDKYRIDYYALDNRDMFGYPDLTIGRNRYDGHADDLEEENLIFSRISDLVTVRSDIFTAYILVRLGHEGPQKRAVAILDRTGVRDQNDNVRIIAYQVLPEPR